MGDKRIHRRNFLQQTGLAIAGILASGTPSWAKQSGKSFVSMNTKTGASEFTASLYERGAVTTYLKSKNELSYIGMPVGGINSGTLYLGGDGQLWLWDIFNLNQEGVNPLDILWGENSQTKVSIRSRDGSAYVAPAKSDEIRPLEQGFAVKVEYDDKVFIHHLREEDWDEVSFEATYPIAKITYTDKASPVTVIMRVYSPFIPLDVDRSGLPATIFNIEVINNSSREIKVNTAGWLENKTALHTATTNRLQRKNTSFKTSQLVGVYSSLEETSFGDSLAEKSFDFGTLCISALNANSRAGVHLANTTGESVFEVDPTKEQTRAAQQRLIGNVVTSLTLLPGNAAVNDFIISWHTPNLAIHGGKKLPEADRGRYYDNQFKNAQEVAEYIASNFAALSSQTFLWQHTWYDSTLPHWFLERTFLNISSLATTTSHRFKSGRYWAWEGVGACEGNCTHVWQYAQAPARIFPAMEKDNRQRVDLGIAMQDDGGIWFRGEYDKRPAIDGQAGRVLGCYREHQMSADSHFLQTNWEKIKRATQFIINQDKNKDGMVDTPLENTLDAVWDGEIAWIVGLCIAAVKAGELMALEMGDQQFASMCHEYVQKGTLNMNEKLFNGEYFIHRPDATKGRAQLGSYNTCHIDQVFGQSWAFQVGLGRILDQQKTLSALRALWKYNFKEDVGPYIKEHSGGRPYAVAGEAGMVMNTNPMSEAKPYGDNVTWQMGYFHECMSGFEHQVAAHMMAEDMTDEALILTKAIHERYHAAKRNPFNEIECSDHYGRAMASYGTFIAACGFEYHGPKGYIRFAPKWNKEQFKAPFTTAESWGTYSQQQDGATQLHTLEIKYGSLSLSTIHLSKINSLKVRHVKALAGAKNIAVKFKQQGVDVMIQFSAPVLLATNEVLSIAIS